MAAATRWFEKLAVRRAGTASQARLLTLLAAPTPPHDELRISLEALAPLAVPALLERIAHHRIDGLAHRALADLPGGSIHPWLRSSLKRRHQRCAAATLSQGLALAELLEALHRAGIPAVVTGGMATVEASYTDAGARPVDQHDLLVRPRDFEAAASILRLLGFVSGAQGVHRHGGVVAVVRDALPPFRGFEASTGPSVRLDELLERSVPGRVAGAPALLPALEDAILLGAVALVRNSFDRLIRVADLAHLLVRRRSAVCWETLGRRAGAAGVSRILAFALEAAVMLGAPVRAALRLDPGVGFIEKVLMSRALDLRPLPCTGGILTLLAAAFGRARRTRIPDAIHSRRLRRVS